MKTMRILPWKAVLVSVLLAACANQMQPAKQALDAAQSAVDASAADASKYMPEHLQSLQTRLATLKAAFEQKDYATVIATAPAVVSDAKKLAQEAAAKKADAQKLLAQQWTQLNAAVPGMLDAVKSRVHDLEKSKRAAKASHLAEAKSALADASSQWEKATAAQQSGDVAGAISSAQDAEAKARSAADTLKLKLPATPAPAQ